ncbi:MAG: hypothetical protein ACRDXD_13855 [Acidimicrobiia bacterium]
MIPLEHFARANMKALQREARARARPRVEVLTLPRWRPALQVVPTESPRAACLCEARTA